MLGTDHVTITRIVSVGLIIFAAEVLFVSTRPESRQLTPTLQVVG